MNSRRIREGYLKAVLRQDIAYFDGLGAGEVATRIQSDTGEFASVERPITPKTSTNVDLIQTGTSEKAALVVQYASSFFSGFISACVTTPVCSSSYLKPKLHISDRGVLPLL